jgi:hypothetical protein
MLLTQFFRWWYSDGWLSVVESLARRSRSLNQALSTGSLIRTLFAPWRRIISYPGASLNAKLHAALDNLFSRIVGFVVRIFVLLAAGVIQSIVMLLTLVEMLVWPLLPLAVIGFLVMAVIQ